MTCQNGTKPQQFREQQFESSNPPRGPSAVFCRLCLASSWHVYSIRRIEIRLPADEKNAVHARILFGPLDLYKTYGRIKPTA